VRKANFLADLMELEVILRDGRPIALMVANVSVVTLAQSERAFSNDSLSKALKVKDTVASSCPITTPAVELN
jgi:hypothetical protein